MSDPNEKNFESLDELFRSTFNGLPASPSASGWDVPSERVWQHVQREIKPPKSGWTMQKFGLLTAFGVSLAVGLYLLLASPQASPEPAGPPAPAIEIPAPAVDAPAADGPAEASAEPSTAEADEPAPRPVARPRDATSVPATVARPSGAHPAPDVPAARPANSTEENTGNAVAPAEERRRPATGSQPLPGSRRAPNTTEKLWRTPLPLLPPYRDTPDNPNTLRVPPGEKN